MKPNEEAQQVGYALQGLLVGSVHKMISDPPLLRIQNVEQPMDNQGFYENHFVVITQSGIRIKVTVEPEESSEFSQAEA